MQTYVKMILEDRDRTEREKREAIAEYDRRLAEADMALMALGSTPANHPSADMVLDILDTEKLTAKERVLIALKEHFPDGAKYGELFQYINERWSHLKINSLSPRLASFQKQGLIERDPETKKWALAPEGGVRKQ